MSDKIGLGDLGLRALSALVLAPVVLAGVWFGGWWFYSIILLAWILALAEWRRMCGPGGLAVDTLLVASGPVGLAAAYWIGLAPAFGATALIGVIAVVAGRAWHGLGVAIIGLPLLALTYLRGADFAGWTGRDALFFLLTVVWATDIAAYGTGRLVGGPRLAPAISPSKTWSGAVGGTLTAAFAGAVVHRWTQENWVFWSLGAGLSLAIVAQIGDLLESFVKRRFGVKDMSALIPGHGGVLDRIDGLLAAAVVMALAVWLGTDGGN
ncbi:MAG: phosphatidate cytidylyltransferase [Alphaproteobacteria bacterium]|nr:phosphatidate cytidylyltransferase [Alphaproteobacteria bacterium]MCZ6765187.1 phosphatidate cytidylyltransferase [Alphaproteobacteria bacterium]